MNEDIVTNLHLFRKKQKAHLEPRALRIDNCHEVFFTYYL
jgi:hypothetical protein